MMEGYNTSNN